MCSARLIFLTSLVVSTGFGSGWLGPSKIPQRGVMGGCPVIAVDHNGTPWVVFTAGLASSDSSIVFARWLGTRWDTATSVGPNGEGVSQTGGPDMVIDDRDVLWAAWDDLLRNGANQIITRYWDGIRWSSGFSLADSIHANQDPHLGSGGGRLWCVWYGGPSNQGSYYSIFARRWDGVVQSWGPRMQVSPSDGFSHWCGMPWVDSLGNPHVVWVEQPHGFIYYSHFDGSRWSTPLALNDSFEGTPYGPPRIVGDRAGNLHVCFCGTPPSSGGFCHIYYTRFDGRRWSPCQRLSQETLCWDVRSDIAAPRPDDVWVVYDRQVELAHRIRVTHFDGKNWSPEEHLDNDSGPWDEEPRISIDSTGKPWAVWMDENDNGCVFYNRYGVLGVGEAAPVSGVRLAPTVMGSLSSAGSVLLSCWLPKAGRVQLEVYNQAGRHVRRLADGMRPAGRFTMRWDGCDDQCRHASSGVYFCRLETNETITTCQAVLLAR